MVDLLAVRRSLNQVKLLLTGIGWNIVATVATYPPGNNTALIIEGSDADSSAKALQNAFSVAGFSTQIKGQGKSIAGAQIVLHLP